MSNSPTLLGLPEELEGKVLKELTSSQDLFAAMMTCHQLKNTVTGDRLLYTNLTVYKSSSNESLARILRSDSEKASRVLSYALELSKRRASTQNEYNWIVDSRSRVGRDTCVLDLLPNLEHLRIVSPWRYRSALTHLFVSATVQATTEGRTIPRVTETRLSKNLKTFYLDSEHPEFQYSFLEVNAILLHSGIQAVTLMNMELHLDFTGLHKEQIPSTLKKLCFHNVTMTAGSLESIIRLVPALQEFTLSFSPHHVSSVRGQFTSTNWIPSMDSVKPTLKKLILGELSTSIRSWIPFRGTGQFHHFNAWRGTAVTSRGVRYYGNDSIRDFGTATTLYLGDFTALKHLELYFGYSLLSGANQRVINSLLPRAPNAGAQERHFTDIFPPNLETLIFRDRKSLPNSSRKWGNLIRFLDDDRCFRNLQRIVVHNNVNTKHDTPREHVVDETTGSAAVKVDSGNTSNAATEVTAPLVAKHQSIVFSDALWEACKKRGVKLVEERGDAANIEAELAWEESESAKRRRLERIRQEKNLPA